MKKTFVPVFCALAFILAGCGQNNSSQTDGSDSSLSSSFISDVSDPETPSSYSQSDEPASSSTVAPPAEDKFLEQKAAILSRHNYTGKLTSLIEEDENETITNTYYNLSDKAFYWTDWEYNAFQTGYVTQKGQGVVMFDRLVDGTYLSTTSFVATNPNIGMSMIYDYMIEHVLTASFIKTGDVYLAKTSENVDENAIMLNMTPYDVRFISSGEYIKAYSTQTGFNLETDYTIVYKDDETLETVTDHGRVCFEVGDIDSTHDEAIESYIGNPTKTYGTPTDWSDETKEYFSTYFNGYVPPLIPSASYSLKSRSRYEGIDQAYYIDIEDYACGDQRNAYYDLLEAQGFEFKGSGKLEKVVLNADETTKNIYTIKITYRYPSEIYHFGTIGDYFPKGVLIMELLFQTKANINVNDVAALNKYIEGTGAKNILPRFIDDGTVSKVANFADNTAYVSQLYETDEFLFVTSLSGNFRLYINSYFDAVKYVDSMRNLFKAKGFTQEEASPLYGVYYLNDSAGSKIRLSYLTQDNASSYPGYIQCGIVVYKASLDNKVIDHIEVVSGTGKNVYNLNETFFFDAKVNAIYRDGTSKDITSEIKIKFQPDMTSVGNKMVIVTYEEDGVTYEAEFNFKVVDSSIPEGSVSLVYKGYDGSSFVDLNNVDLVSSIMPSSAKPGEEVNIQIVPSEGYEFKSFHIDDPSNVLSYDALSNPLAFIIPTEYESMTIGIEVSRIKVLESISVDNPKTSYETGDEFIAPQVIAHYNTGDETVDSSLVTFSGFDSSSAASSQTITVSYLDKTTSYEIQILDASVSRYTITFVADPGVNAYVSYPTSSTTYEEGTNIQFKISLDDGVILDGVSVKCGEEDVPYNSPMLPFRPSYSFSMPSGNVIITIHATGGEANLMPNGTYSAPSVKQSGADTTYSITFNSDGTGYYSRTPASSTDSSTKNINFTYVAKGTSITLTYVSKNSDGFSNFANYRPFDNDNDGATNVCLLNSDGSITMSLYNYSGVENVSWTFSK